MLISCSHLERENYKCKSNIKCTLFLLLPVQFLSPGWCLIFYFRTCCCLSRWRLGTASTNSCTLVTVKLWWLWRRPFIVSFILIWKATTIMQRLRIRGQCQWRMRWHLGKKYSLPMSNRKMCKDQEWKHGAHRSLGTDAQFQGCTYYQCTWKKKQLWKCTENKIMLQKSEIVSELNAVIIRFIVIPENYATNQGSCP